MRILLSSLLVSLLIPFAAPRTQASTLSVSLDTLLAKMDEAAAGFRSMNAGVQWVKYTAIVDDRNVEEGVLRVRKKDDGEFELLIEFQKPYPYYLHIDGTKVQIYRPRIATVEIYDVSKSKDALEQALLLGFGARGTFLRENYDIELLGEEQAAGEPTVKIGLVPKEEEMQRKIPKLEMWVSKNLWQPVQQKLYERNKGDYRLYTYTNVTINPDLPDSAFELKIPKDVKKVHPQR